MDMRKVFAGYGAPVNYGEIKWVDVVRLEDITVDHILCDMSGTPYGFDGTRCIGTIITVEGGGVRFLTYIHNFGREPSLFTFEEIGVFTHGGDFTVRYEGLFETMDEVITAASDLYGVGRPVHYYE